MIVGAAGRLDRYRLPGRRSKCGSYGRDDGAIGPRLRGRKLGLPATRRGDTAVGLGRDNVDGRIGTGVAFGLHAVPSERCSGRRTASVNEVFGTDLTG